MIARALDKYLPPEKSEPRILHKAMRYSVFSGGKRIRPKLVLEAASACGGKAKDALAAACAVEFVHTYSLIHDDLPSMDDDDFRRGKPTCHRLFGEATAILAGDALLTLAFNVVAANLEPKKAAAVIKKLSEAAGAAGMVGGQSLDLELQGKIERRKLLDRVNDLKTAGLFEASAAIGAITAGASPDKIRALSRFGRLLGRAFQIADDIVDNGNYMKTFGRKTAEEDVCRLIKEAKAALKIFGKGQVKLSRIADAVMERIR